MSVTTVSAPTAGELAQIVYGGEPPLAADVVGADFGELGVTFDHDGVRSSIVEDAAAAALRSEVTMSLDIDVVMAGWREDRGRVMTQEERVAAGVATMIAPVIAPERPQATPTASTPVKATRHAGRSLDQRFADFWALDHSTITGKNDGFWRRAMSAIRGARVERRNPYFMD